MMQAWLPKHLHTDDASVITETFTYRWCKRDYRSIYTQLMQAWLPKHLHIDDASVITEAFTYRWYKRDYQLEI